MTYTGFKEGVAQIKKRGGVRNPAAVMGKRMWEKYGKAGGRRLIVAGKRSKKRFGRPATKEQRRAVAQRILGRKP